MPKISLFEYLSVPIPESGEDKQTSTTRSPETCDELGLGAIDQQMIIHLRTTRTAATETTDGDIMDFRISNGAGL